jgi:hypothetical protein
MFQTCSTTFPHHRLEAYRLALQLAAAARQLGTAIPRGHRHIADHLQRAADHTVLLVAEGANRWGAGEKRQRFNRGGRSAAKSSEVDGGPAGPVVNEAKGECGEAAAGADLIGVHGLVPQAQLADFQQLANRLAATLTGLIRRFS